jgi:hypothetical protein
VVFEIFNPQKFELKEKEEKNPIFLYMVQASK